MKKLFAIILVLALTLVSVGFAEEEALPPMPEEAAVYEGTWVCDRASIEIIWEEEGFRVFISWGSSATENAEWEYSCYYHENDRTLVSMPFGYYNAETKTLESMPSGIHRENVFGEDGEIVTSNIVYEDGEAIFTLDADGHLLWQDAKADAGKDMIFERVEIPETK